MPYFTPPIYYSPPQGIRPSAVPPYAPGPGYGETVKPPLIEMPPVPAPHVRREPPRAPQGRPSPRDAQAQAEIEHEIMDFCNANPDEAFCGKLGEWLRSHPQARPR
jgi:hypothetical protein